MNNKPPFALILLVVGVPALIAAFLLWPRIQEQLAEIAVEEVEIESGDNAQQDTPSESPPKVVPSNGSTEESNKERSEPLNSWVTPDQIAESRTVTELTPQIEQAREKTPIEQAVENQKKELQRAASSFEALLNTIDHESIEKHASAEWADISLLVSQAQAAEDPTVAGEGYRLAESRLEQLRLDIPNRKALDQLRVLLIREDYGSFLQQLVASNNRPQLRDRLTDFWLEVDGWGKEQWLSLIQEELFELAPDDGGFADIYHALADLQSDLGDESGANKSNETAWENSFRITDPTRAAESGLRSVQRFAKDNSYPAMAERVNKVSGELITSVSEPHDQMRLFSEVGRISRKPDGKRNIIGFIQTIANRSRIFLRTYWKQIYECRIYAETKGPSEIRNLCVKVPKYNGSRGYEPFSANTMTYAYAADAAARTNNESMFWESLLLAEAQQLDDTGVGEKNQAAQTALVEADLRKGNVFRALMTAMNMSDEKIRARMLLPILAEHPEQTPANIDLNFIQNFGTLDQGCVAISKMFPSFANQLGGREKAIEWILKMRSKSVKVAALIALARSQLLPKQSKHPRVADRGELDPSDFRGMLQNAEADAALIQASYDRAWAYLWIAFCWKKMDQPASYLAALEKSDDAIKSCWAGFWQDFTAPRRRGYQRNGVPREQTGSLSRITKYYTTLAEIQAFQLNEPRRAIENVIYAARSTHPLNADNIETRGELWVVTEAVHQACGIRTRVLESAYAGNNADLYFKALQLSAKGDFQGLVEATNSLSSGKKTINYLTRAMAEAAILAAKQGDVNRYRTYRRKAAGNIKSKGASSSIALALYQADAFANEFNLAQKGANSRGYLSMFGPPAKVRATLCGQLSLASRTDDAMKQLPSPREPFFRIQAVHSVAACRSKSLPKAQLLEWVDSLQLLDRVAAICGIAYPEPMPLK